MLLKFVIRPGNAYSYHIDTPYGFVIKSPRKTTINDPEKIRTIARCWLRLIQAREAVGCHPLQNTWMERFQKNVLARKVSIERWSRKEDYRNFLEVVKELTEAEMRYEAIKNQWKVLSVHCIPPAPRS